MAGWLAAIRTWSQARTLRRRPIPEDVWQLTVARYPFISRRPLDDLARLRNLATLFLARKEFAGGGGLEVTDEMAVAVAAQACLPVLHLGLEMYDSFVGIVMHPAEVSVEREVMDEDGIVHVEERVMSGETIAGGPMMLAWQDVSGSGPPSEWAYNVVIHEFAHVIDMRNGEADGVPPLSSRPAHEAWQRVLTDEYEAFCEQVDEGFDTVIDPYGSESIDEFFAVAVETFFVEPRELQHHHPALYELFAGYFQQDPVRFA